MGEEQEKRKEFSFSWLALFLFVLVVVFAIMASAWLLLVYFEKFPDLPTDQRDWGTLGDFFGGTLNPIFGFLSLIALLSTIILQSVELRETRKEIKLSRRAQESSELALRDQAASLQQQVDEARKSTMTQGFLQAVSFIQRDDIRRARGVVIQLWESRNSPGVHWEDYDQWTAEEKNACENACQSFDVIGMMVLNEMAPTEILLGNWARAIGMTWKVSQPCITFRRAREGQQLWQSFEIIASKVVEVDGVWGLKNG